MSQKPYPVGTVVTHKTALGPLKKIKMETGWRSLSIAEVRPKKKTGPKPGKQVRTSKHIAPPPKVQPRAPQASKRASSDIVRKTDTGRPGIVNDRNPEKMKVKKEDGGQWVRIDSKTQVYRKTPCA